MNNKGVALILAFIFMVSLTVVAAAYLFLVTHDTKNASAQLNNEKALYLADAGLNKAVWYLMNTAPDTTTNGSWRTDDTYSYPQEPPSYPGGTRDPQQEALGDGTYTMWVETSGSDIMVTVRGTVNNIERIIQETITIAVGGVPQAFNYAQFSGGNIDFRNSSGTITGDLATVGTVDNEGGMNIPDTITEGSAGTVPSVDMASYVAIADTTVSGNQVFSSGTYSGIYYIDGAVTIQDDVIFNGTIIATGNISFTNTDNFMSNPTSNYPALVAGGTLGGKLITSTINGLVFAEGTITLSNGTNSTINGSIISPSNIDMKGGSGWAVTYDAGLASDPPPYFSEPGGGAGVTGDGWKEI